jgi:hypothetical protein
MLPGADICKELQDQLFRVLHLRMVAPRIKTSNMGKYGAYDAPQTAYEQLNNATKKSDTCLVVIVRNGRTRRKSSIHRKFWRLPNSVGLFITTIFGADWCSVAIHTERALRETKRDQLGEHADEGHDDRIEILLRNTATSMSIAQ